MISRSDTRRGQSMVEFALILLPFVIVLVGLFDVGRAIYAMSTVNNAAREGARLAIVDQVPTHICDAVAAAGVGLGINPSNPCGDLTDPVTITVDYRDPASPTVANSCPNTGQPTMIGCIAFVRVAYDYVAATPLIGSLVGPVTIDGESSFPVENFCNTADCPIGS